MEMRDYSRARWVPLLILVGIVAACQPAVTPTANAPTPTPTPPQEPQASCDDSAITLLYRDGAGIHGAIVADTLHLGGATAPATCSAPVNQSLASRPDDRAAQAQQSPYYLIVIRYPGGDNRLYVVRRGDDTTCVVDSNDRCVAQVSDLPDDFDVGGLPDDVAPTIPAGRPAPAAPEEPAAPSEPVNPGEPGAPSAPGGLPAAPEAAFGPHPPDGATDVSPVSAWLGWHSAYRAKRYEVYWGTSKNLADDASLGTPIHSTGEDVEIRRPGATAPERWLPGETTYYWRVDAINDAGTTRGPVWSFTTGEVPALPAAETGPPGSVAAVTITTPGKGYASAPDVSFVGGGGSGATGIALLNGSVTAVTIVRGGKYVKEAYLPRVEFREPNWGFYCCSGYGASGSVTVAIDNVEGVSIDNPGSGYTSPPDVAFSGGGGSGATARAFLKHQNECCAEVGAVTVDNPGSGYTSPPDVTFSGGGGSGAAGTAVLESGGVASVSITNGGSGYASAPSISFSGGGGSGAAATAALSSGVYAVGMTNWGSGYHSPPTVSFSGGGGSGAAGTAYMSGPVSSVVITSGGHSYNVAPRVKITGGGGGATAIAEISGGVAAVVITDGGSGYTSAPSVVFSGGGGSGATAAATLEEE